MVVRVCKFIALVRNAWVENVFHTFVDQPLYMSVSQFCRVAFRLTWNGLNTEFIMLLVEAGESLTENPS